MQHQPRQRRISATPLLSALHACRDPNLLDTVKAYDDTCDFLRNTNLDDAALTRVIVGAIGEMDSYQLPDGKGRTAFARHLLGITDEQRQQRREQVRYSSALHHTQQCHLLPPPWLRASGWAFPTSSASSAANRRVSSAVSAVLR